MSERFKLGALWDCYRASACQMCPRRRGKQAPLAAALAKLNIPSQCFHKPTLDQAKAPCLSTLSPFPFVFGTPACSWRLARRKIAFQEFHLTLPSFLFPPPNAPSQTWTPVFWGDADSLLLLLERLAVCVCVAAAAANNTHARIKRNFSRHSNVSGYCKQRRVITVSLSLSPSQPLSQAGKPT